MRFSLRATLIPVCVSAVLGLGLTGCPGDKDKPASQTQADGKTYHPELWVKYKDVPPGADPSVSAEMGGKGFEEIADSLGFVSYTPAPDELKYFGDPRAKLGGEIHTTISRFPLSFRPFGQNSNFTENSIINGMVYQTLLGTHPLTYDYVPSLATHWKISPDKMTYVFRLDPNARFSDGKPVTAEDVVATWKLMMDESVLEPSLQLTYGKFEQPVAVSKYILEAKVKEKNWRNFLYFSGMVILPAHEIGNLSGKQFLDKYEFTMPAGSGEYILLDKDIIKGQAYTLTRRDDWFGKEYPMNKYAGNFDRISFEIVKDNPTLEYEKFKKGDQDYILFTSLTTEKWINDTTYDALQKGWIQKRRILTDAPYGTSGYGFNMRKPPFDDIRVRKAFAYLHNREAIIDKLLFNEYTFTDSYYANTVYENPANPKIRYNPEMAAQLLAEAGWKTKNAQGILVKDGKPFVLEMGLPKVIERFVTPYQQELRKAGIDLQIKPQDGNTLFKNAMERNFSLYWISWSGLQIPNPETSISSKLADLNDNNNLEGFKNARVDQLLAEYDTTFTRARQVEIIREIDKIQMETYADALAWNPRGIRIAYWDKFGMPDYILPRFTQFAYLDASIFAMWWYDADKAKLMDDARNKKTQLGTNTATAQEIDFWKKFPQAGIK